MPIEVQIEKKYGKNLPTAETQRLCRAFATEQIEQQKADFKRLGVLGDWDHPYLTMDFGNEADEIRALGKLLEKGYVYRGLKPVNWCFDCGSALAEAEVEYEDRKDPAIDVGFRVRRAASKLAKAFGLEDRRRPGFAVIWTTTPWTLPATRRSTCIPSSTTPWSTPTRGLLILAADLREACLKRYGLDGQDRSATVQGQGAREHPLPASVLRPRSRPSISATTSRSTPAPASCTPRRPTASRTSTPAAATA